MLDHAHNLISKVRMAFYTPAEIDEITASVLTHYKSLCSTELKNINMNDVSILNDDHLSKIASHSRGPSESATSVWTSRQREFPSADTKEKKPLQRILSIESIRKSFVPCEASSAFLKPANKADSGFVEFATSRSATTSIRKLGDCVDLIEPTAQRSKASATKKSKRCLYYVEKSLGKTSLGLTSELFPGHLPLIIQIKNGQAYFLAENLGLFTQHIAGSLESIVARINNEKTPIDIQQNLFLDILIGTVSAIALEQMNANSIKRVVSELAECGSVSDIRVQPLSQHCSTYASITDCINSLNSEHFFNIFEKIFGNSQIQICIDVQDTESLKQACALSRQCDAALQINFATNNYDVFNNLSSALMSLHVTNGHEGRAAHFESFEITRINIEQVKINALYDAWLHKKLSEDAPASDIARIVQEKVFCTDINRELSLASLKVELKHDYKSIIDRVAHTPSLEDAYLATFDPQSDLQPIRVTETSSKDEALEYINATTFIGTKTRLDNNPRRAQKSDLQSQQTDDSEEVISCAYSFASDFLCSSNAELSFHDTQEHLGTHWARLGIKNSSTFLAQTKRKMQAVPPLQEVAKLAVEDVLIQYDQLRFVQLLLKELQSIKYSSLGITETARLTRLEAIRHHVPSITINTVAADSFLLEASLCLQHSTGHLNLSEQKAFLHSFDERNLELMNKALTPSWAEKNFSEKFLSLLADLLAETEKLGDIGRETTVATVILAASICGVGVKRSEIVSNIESLFSETAYAVCKGGIKLNQCGLCNGTYDFKARISPSDVEVFEQALKKYVAIQAASKGSIRRPFWLI